MAKGVAGGKARENLLNQINYSTFFVLTAQLMLAPTPRATIVTYIIPRLLHISYVIFIYTCMHCTLNHSTFRRFLRK